MRTFDIILKVQVVNESPRQAAEQAMRLIDAGEVTITVTENGKGVGAYFVDTLPSPFKTICEGVWYTRDEETDAEFEAQYSIKNVLVGD